MPTKKANSTETPTSRKDVKYVFARTLKKPYLSEDPDTGEITTEAIFVVENGSAQIHPCSNEAYRRINGKRFKSKPHSGLWRKKHTSFLVAIEKGGSKRVVGVDTFPEHLYGNSSSDAPTFRKNQESIKLTVDQKTGDINVEELPPMAVPNLAVMVNLLKAIHATPSVAAGDTINGYEVVSKDGNKLTLEAVSDPDEGEE
jgi:hypothetical protein